MWPVAPFCCREASLTLTSGWDSLGTQVSCPLIWLLGEYSSNETEPLCEVKCPQPLFWGYR